MNLFCPGSQSCFVIISGHDGLGDSTAGADCQRYDSDIGMNLEKRTGKRLCQSFYTVTDISVCIFFIFSSVHRPESRR